MAKAPILPAQKVPFSDVTAPDVFNKSWFLFFDGIVSAILALLKLLTLGTHADRLLMPPKGFPLGAVYFETDRGVQYQVRLVNGFQAWVYVAGTMSGATLAALPADLGANDAGFLFSDAQYQHNYQWTGSAWKFAPDDDHLAGQCMFSAQGGSPLAGVWQVCDGSTVSVSQGDGTVANFTTPDLSGETFLMGGGPTAIRAATALQWDPAAKTDDESAHTHPLPNVPEFFPATGATANIVSVNVTGAGSAHHHTLSNANAKLLPASLTNHGLPQNTGLKWWMRQ